MSATPEMAADPPAERRRGERRAATPAPGPGKAAAPDRREDDSTIPPGWSYNPSTMRERHLLLGIAALGLLNAIYLALTQFGVAPPIWDPFFGTHSSYLVTHSKVERLLPFPDAALGALAYTCDLVFGLIGGPDRWRAKPWAVIAFVGTITGLAVVSTLLTISQGVLVQSWCTLCLLSAVLSGIIFSVGFGEVLATLQYLKRVWVRTRSMDGVWRAIWGRTSDVVAGN